jgi:hypothetical protein
MSLTIDAALDNATGSGWVAWRSIALTREPDHVVRWLAAQLPEGVERDDVEAPLRVLLSDAPPDEHGFAASELSDLFEADAPALAALFLDALLVNGRLASDAEMMFDATVRIAQLDEEFGDPLTAAENYIAFLNWRRQEGSASDAESVLTAFDEVIRLAELDEAPQAVATFSFLQAQFLQVVEGDDPAAEAGDWAAGSSTFEPWDTA